MGSPSQHCLLDTCSPTGSERSVRYMSGANRWITPTAEMRTIDSQETRSPTIREVEGKTGIRRPFRAPRKRVRGCRHFQLEGRALPLGTPVLLCLREWSNPCVTSQPWTPTPLVHGSSELALRSLSRVALLSAVLTNTPQAPLNRQPVVAPPTYRRVGQAAKVASAGAMAET